MPRELDALGDGSLRWLPADEEVLRFGREPGFECLVNLRSEPVLLPVGTRILLASEPIADDRRLPPDTAAWLATGS